MALLGWDISLCPDLGADVRLVYFEVESNSIESLPSIVCPTNSP